MIKFGYYLTSLEPGISQTICSQSIGGYCSDTLLYPITTLSSNVGLYDETFYVNTPPNGWSEWDSIYYFIINNEMISISSSSISGEIDVNRRGVNSILEMHLEGDTVYGVKKDLFNDVFNSSNEQYRCIAVKNTTSNNDPSSFLSAENISVFLKQNSRNSKVKVEIAIEIPKSQYLSGISSGRTSMTLTDPSLIGMYPDNYFSECFLKPYNEEGGIVRTFDSTTGTFTYYSSFNTNTEDKEYEVFSSPSQRLKTGIESPLLGENSSLFSEASQQVPILLDSLSEDSSGVTLKPNDIFYIWLKRTISKGSILQIADDFVINISYNSTD